MKALAALALSLVALPAAAPADSRDDASPRDIQRLQEDLSNLDEDMRVLEPGDPKADAFRQRAEDIREETIYIKVKMRHHQGAGGEGTGVAYDEVAGLRRSIADLRDDMDRSFGQGERGRDVRLSEGTQFAVRLDEPLSSRTARREDRFEASIFRPVRAEGTLAIPAGTRIRGIVRDVEPAQRPSKGGKLDLDFDALYLDPERLDIRGRVVSISEGDAGNTAGKAGIGAVLGGILGGILGGQKGAIVGILVGGTGAVVATKGEEAELPAGTILTVRLERPLVLPRR
jgi:hypothetical protein